MAFDPTINSGARGSEQTNLFNGIDSRRGFSFDNQITKLVPNEAPFVSTLMAYKRKPVNDPDHKYMEHRPAWLDNRSFFSDASNAPACSATYSGKAFDNWKVQASEDGGDAVDFFTAGDDTPYIIQVLDADDLTQFCNFYVNNIDSTTAIDVNQLTDTPGFDVADNDPIQIIGIAFEEGGDKSDAYSDIVSMKWASCQIFKHLSQASRTVMKTWVAGGNEWERIQAETATTHKVDMERNFIFGTRSTNTEDQGSANDPFGAPVATTLGGTNKKPIRTSISIQQAAHWADSVGLGGSRVFSNTIATYKYDDFIDDMEKLFEFGSDSRYFFGGTGVLSILTKMALNADSNMTYENGMNEAGVKYKKFLTPHGDLKFVRHPLFRGNYANKAFAVDMNNIELLVFDGTFIRTDVETPGYDGKESEIISDMGLEVGLPEASVAEFNWK